MNKCKLCKLDLIRGQKSYCSQKCKSEYQSVAPKIQLDKSISFQCKIDGKIFNNSSKRSGALVKYSKNVLCKEFNIDDWLEIPTPIKVEKATWNCPICNWSTVDLKNKSGWIKHHVNRTHNLSIEDFCNMYPDNKKLWSHYWKLLDRTTELIDPSASIKCGICNKSMKKISNTHLKTHNITPDEYKDKFGIGVLSSINTRKKMQTLYHANTKLLDTAFTSNGQAEITTFINSLGIETRVRRKDHIELDIFIPNKNIAIEYNGLYWHSELHGGKSRNYHLEKTEYCEKNGIHLIHIFEDEWKQNSDLIKSRLMNLLGLNTTKIHGRKCHVKEITNSEKATFLKNNHLQGNDNSSVYLGLYHMDDLVSMMTFRKPLVSMGHKNISSNTIELSRFCSLNYTTVIGAANKLFKYFLERYTDYTRIITYADRRWTTTLNTSLYDTLNFKCIGISAPNYWYMKRHTERLSRFNFTKHKILENYPNADKDLSEWQNMINLKFDRIWDCGTLRYEFEK